MIGLVRSVHSWYLTFRYSLFQYFLKAEGKNAEVEWHANSDFAATNLRATASFLQEYLRVYPYWLRGHREIVEAYLALNEVELAYGAVHAFNALAPNRKRWLGEFYLGKCYLRGRKLVEAEGILGELHSSRPGDAAVSEEYAAALMGLGKFADAERILQLIPAATRSGEAAVALDACRSRETLSAFPGKE